MRNIILFFAFIGLHWVSVGQDFSINRIEPMLSAQKELMNIYPIRNQQLDCPPKIIHHTHAGFRFLDSLDSNNELDDLFLSIFIKNNCANFYNVLTTHKLFLPEYIAALKKHDLDTNYALLPLTMSADNPSLKYNTDKSGAWQLSFVNARKYGLQIDAYFDERNDIQKSSEAAAKYLKFLQKYYLNNDLLVVTAFYTSVPFVNKHLNQLENVNTKSFVSSLPPEIKGYLFYLRSWGNWIENFGVPQSLTSFNKDLEWSKIESVDTLSFETISQFMDISVRKMELMNPAYTGKYVLPHSSIPFYLPKKIASDFSKNHVEFIAFQKEQAERKKKELAEQKKRMESGIPDLNKFKAVTYTVKSGDVLGKIADRNNLRVSQIKQWNNLASDRIDIGQKLVLYVPKSSNVDLPPDTDDNKISTKPVTPKPGSGSPQIYTVKPGESLWLIAKKFPGVSAENIMGWNGCTDKISPGMELKIYSTK